MDGFFITTLFIGQC